MTTFQIHSSVQKKNDTYIHALKMTTFQILIQVSIYMPTVTIITVGLYRPYADGKTTNRRRNLYMPTVISNRQHVI